MLGDKFRLRFEKAGVFRLLSHHDLMRVFERMLRRAGLPFKSTAGFHPGPRVVFAQSLPLGVAGRDEVVELELTEPREADTVLGGLNAEAPEGLHFTQAAVVPMKATAIPRRIVYSLPLPPDRAAAAAAAAGQLMAAPAVWVDRVRPSPKGLNIRPYLRSVRVEGIPEPNPPGLPSLGEKGGDDTPALPGSVESVGTNRAIPSSVEEGAIDSQGHLVGSTGSGKAGVPSPPFPPKEGGPGGLGRSGLHPARLVLDLWVTSTGTARADELLRLLGVDDLLDAGAVLERTRVELRDEAAAPADPTDTPPDGPADTRPLDPAASAAARAALDQPAATPGVAVPGDMAVE
jgi:radical SAM-linked protein